MHEQRPESPRRLAAFGGLAQQSTSSRSDAAGSSIWDVGETPPSQQQQQQQQQQFSQQAPASVWQTEGPAHRQHQRARPAAAGRAAVVVRAVPRQTTARTRRPARPTRGGGQKDAKTRAAAAAAAAATAAAESDGRYIPGMEGAVKPDDPVTADVFLEQQQADQQRQALQRLQVGSTQLT